MDTDLLNCVWGCFLIFSALLVMKVLVSAINGCEKLQIDFTTCMKLEECNTED